MFFLVEAFFVVFFCIPFFLAGIVYLGQANANCLTEEERAKKQSDGTTLLILAFMLPLIVWAIFFGYRKIFVVRVYTQSGHTIRTTTSTLPLGAYEVVDV